MYKRKLTRSIAGILLLQSDLVWTCFTDLLSTSIGDFDLGNQQVTEEPDIYIYIYIFAFAFFFIGDIYIYVYCIYILFCNMHTHIYVLFNHVHIYINKLYTCLPPPKIYLCVAQKINLCRK